MKVHVEFDDEGQCVRIFDKVAEYRLTKEYSDYLQWWKLVFEESENLRPLYLNADCVKMIGEVK